MARPQSNQEIKVEWQRRLAEMRPRLRQEAKDRAAEETILLIKKAKNALDRISKNKKDIASGRCSSCAESAIRKHTKTLSVVEDRLASYRTRLPRNLRRAKERLLG